MVPFSDSPGSYSCTRIQSRVSSYPISLRVPLRKLVTYPLDLVYSFSLAVHLQMIGQTVNLMSPLGCVQLLPKVSDKLQPSIGDNCLQNSMQA
jgi:hypothetical protein